jgi:hypothetical protein
MSDYQLILGVVKRVDPEAYANWGDDLKWSERSLKKMAARLNSDANFAYQILDHVINGDCDFSERYRQLFRTIFAAELAPPPVDRSNQCTIHGGDPEEVRKRQLEEGNSGQHSDYIILCEEERAKGFVRPVRRSYKHVGIRPQYPTRELTAEEKEQWSGDGVVAYEEYPECNCTPTAPGTLGHADTCPRRRGLGRFWTADELKSGCGAVTTMGLALAETYARDPKFYGATMCCTCNKHLPVKEFVWEGTNEVLGS